MRKCFSPKFYCSPIMSCVRNAQRIEGHRLRFRDKTCAGKIQHGLQRFIVKNIEGKSTKANDLSHILKK